MFTYKITYARDIAADVTAQAFDIVLRNELTGISTPSHVVESSGLWLDEKIKLCSQSPNLLRYATDINGRTQDVRAQALTLSDLTLSSQRLLCTPRKAPRKISKVPYKVLDAPDLQVCV